MEAEEVELLLLKMNSRAPPLAAEAAALVAGGGASAVEHGGLLVQCLVKYGLRPLVSTSTGERVGINLCLHSPLLYPTSPPPQRSFAHRPVPCSYTTPSSALNDEALIAAPVLICGPSSPSHIRIRNYTRI